MVKTRHIRHNMPLLAIVTATMLTGIMLLQVYWLYTSYKEQQNRFTGDIANALTQISVNAPIMNMLHAGYTGNATTAAEVTAKLKEQLGNVKQINNSTVTIEIPDTATGAVIKTISALSTHTATTATLPSPEEINSMLQTYKQAMAAELAARAIHTPFELAITNRGRTVLAATCDSARFQSIPVKSATSPLLTNSGLMLQAAFPDANLYLLRRMAIILSVTCLLIIIGAYSFCYMLINFFRQKKMADIRNDFMNNMTHELRTPISSAMVAMEVIAGKKRPLDEHTKTEYLEIAQAELQRLSGLTDKVLKMAAFDKSEVQINKTKTEITPLVAGVINSMRPIADAANAVINVTIGPETLTIAADKEHLAHVLQNLLENAIKYNDKPHPFIAVTITGGNKETSIAVADNGMGIPAAYTTKVFDKFFRVPTGDRHDIKGYGLGLGYVSAIVKLHNGSISLKSKEKEGTTFTIHLPNE